MKSSHQYNGNNCNPKYNLVYNQYNGSKTNSGSLSLNTQIRIRNDGIYKLSYNACKNVVFNSKYTHKGSPTNQVDRQARERSRLLTANEADK